jgi:hypothetical protein
MATSDVLRWLLMGGSDNTADAERLVSGTIEAAARWSGYDDEPWWLRPAVCCWVHRPVL